jgi:leader peptidase (prepilin peptidase)/N-methyltransferase
VTFNINLNAYYSDAYFRYFKPPSDSIVADTPFQCEYAQKLKQTIAIIMNNLHTLLTQNSLLLILLAGIIGLVMGSFLNVVIHRLPKMMALAWQKELAQDDTENLPKYNLLTPRSACPHCNHSIGALENIPIISYVLQKGTCRHCKNSISARYLVVEVLSGLIVAFIAWQFGWSMHTIASSIFALGLLTLTCIDLETQLLPDNITLPLVWLGLLFNLNQEFTSIESAVLGAVFGYLILWSVYWLFKIITNKEGMGYGDFKMLAAIGAWLGWAVLPLVMLISSLTASIVGITLILLKKQDRATAIPYGPYLALAGLIALFKTPILGQVIGI